MTLLQGIEAQLRPPILYGGRECFRRGAVVDIGLNEHTLHAVVGGDDVRIKFAGGEEIEYSCSCSYFVSNDDVCKHIWAVFLAAGRDKLLPDWSRRRTPNLIPIEPDEPQDEDDPPGDDDCSIARSAASSGRAVALARRAWIKSTQSSRVNDSFAITGDYVTGWTRRATCVRGGVIIGECRIPHDDPSAFCSGSISVRWP